MPGDDVVGKSRLLYDSEQKAGVEGFFTLGDQMQTKP
jgi:hypothetical protein